jgi:hypothetical protein
MALMLALLVPSMARAQGEKNSSDIALLANPTAMKPGQWVLAPEIAKEGPVLVLVDLTAQLAFVYRNGVIIGVSTISSGKPGHETPTGVFQILQKDADHRSSTYNNAPMFYQERLTWDGVALHAGGLPGYPESHGCVHLPIEFARKLFGITTMGGTVVVTGRAGAPVRALAGGVLSPDDVSGSAIAHTPLGEEETFTWDDAASPAGPVSIIISTTDQRVVVLRGGKEIARARAVIDGHLGTHVAVLHRGADGSEYWMLVGVPGHAEEANHPIDALALDRLRLPARFLAKLRAVTVEGTTALVTSATVHPGTSGKPMTLLAAMN